MDFCYVTPSHRGDLERFELLRHSIRKFSPGAAHYVLLDTEDLALFDERFGKEPGVHWVTSQELLPRTIEQRRLRRKSWLGRVLRSVAWRTHMLPDPLNGWRLQQLLKLHFLNACPHAAAVFLDSDIVLCGPLGAADYHVDGALRLLESPATNLEDYAFDLTAHLMLRQSLLERRPQFNYIHQAPRFLRTTGQALMRRLQTCAPDGWEDRFIQLAFPSEYCLLGYAARELEHYQGYTAEPGTPDQWVYRLYDGDQKALDHLLATCAAEQGRRKFILIQSNLGMPADSYADRVRNLIDQF